MSILKRIPIIIPLLLTAVVVTIVGLLAAPAHAGEVVSVPALCQLRCVHVTTTTCTTLPVPHRSTSSTEAKPTTTVKGETTTTAGSSGSPSSTVAVSGAAVTAASEAPAAKPVVATPTFTG